MTEPHSAEPTAPAPEAGSGDSASRTTLLAELAFPYTGADGLVRFPALAAESALWAGVGLLLTARWSGSEGGVISIFLASAALTPRLVALLEENRRLVYAAGIDRSRGANQLTVLSVLSMFAGLLLAFVFAGLLLGPEGTLKRFAAVGQVATLSGGDLLDRKFGSMSAITLHNLSVLGSVTVLAFVYRAFGLTTVLVWNAASWGLVVTGMAVVALHRSGLPTVSFLPQAALALGPHLVLEGFAYIAGGLAAVYASQALTKYSLRDARVRAVGRVATRLLALALAAVVLGAWLESTLPTLLLGRLR